MCLLTIPKGDVREPKITLTGLIDEGIRNLIALFPRALFSGLGSIVLLCKANLEHKV